MPDDTVVKFMSANQTSSDVPEGTEGDEFDIELGEQVTSERLKTVLEYLYRETMKSDYKMTAHLIGVAAASLEHP